VKGVRSLVLPAGTGERLLTVAPLQRKPVARSGIIATAPQTSGTNTLWTAALPDEMECDALVLAGGAVLAAVSSRKGVAAAKPEILAFKAEDGAPLWRTTLPDAVLPECMAVDRDGRIIVSLHGGRVVCLAGRR
jgi:outer membrane protein assembly factor BamB